MKKNHAQINRDLGAVIRSERQKINVSINDLAKFSATSQGNLSKIENGNGNLTVETLVKIANAIERDPAFLLQQAIRL